MAADGGRALVLSADVAGGLRANAARSVPWRERLDAYARVAGLGYWLSESVLEVWVAPRGGRFEPGRGFVALAEFRDDTASLAGPSPSSSEAAAVADPERAVARVLALEHAGASAVAKVLERSAKSWGLVVSADAASNALVLSGAPEAIERAGALATELDAEPRRILLEARIIEVSRSASRELGIEWKLAGAKVGGAVSLPATDSAGGAVAESAALLVGTTGTPSLELRLGMLEADGRVHVISRPRVVMVEGSPAVIESARVLRIRLPDQGAVVGEEVTAGSSQATEQVPVGVRLRVVPAVRSGDQILLRVEARSSSLGPPLPPDDIPQVLSRTVEAEVRVADGETVVLGGLVREGSSRTGTGVPILRSIPGLGALFGKRERARDAEELLVLVTPHLLD